MRIYTRSHDTVVKFSKLQVLNVQTIAQHVLQNLQFLAHGNAHFNVTGYVDVIARRENSHVLIALSRQLALLLHPCMDMLRGQATKNDKPGGNRRRTLLCSAYFSRLLIQSSLTDRPPVRMVTRLEAFSSAMLVAGRVVAILGMLLGATEVTIIMQGGGEVL